MHHTAVKAIDRKSNLKLFLLATAILAAILFILYIFQASMMVKETFAIKDVEGKIEEMNEANKDLEITFSQKNSLKSSEELLEELNFVKVTKIDYIRVLETAVAAK